MDTSAARGAALCLLALATPACGNQPGPAANKEPPAPTASAAPITSAASTVTAAPAPALPTLALERFAPAGTHPNWVYGVEGAIMVVEDVRVGRVVGEGIEWLKKTIPRINPALGPNRIDSVHGRWPDSIGIMYSNENGRASQPTYLPLTGVGLQYSIAGGGGLAFVYGVVRVGESTILGGYSLGEGVELKTVRGTAVRKPQTPEQAGCKEGEMRKVDSYMPKPPALTPSVIGSTPAGTLVSVGMLCEKRGPAAEIWDKAGKSRIVDLSRWWKKMAYWPRLVAGNGDELWAYSDEWGRILHYRDGEFEALPDLPRPAQNLFVSAGGKVHASDGQTLHRYEGARWLPIAHLAVPQTERFFNVVMDEQDTIWVSNGGVNRLRPTPPGPSPVAAVSPDACPTPFVYLYAVSSDNGPKFTYPATRKALSTFPGIAEIGLVEFGSQLGVTVTSKAQGEALIAHLHETMKDEDPRFFCYAPKKGRKIELDAK
jgi:hypothetical protein